MDRPQFEVADVFRYYGTDYRLQNGASMSNAQHRVMTAIEVCRTAVLGGHMEQCDQFPPPALPPPIALPIFLLFCSWLSFH